jgi:putative membrane protein
MITHNDPVYTNEHVLLGKVQEYMHPYSFSLFNPWLIFCGMVAVCALLLPGLSGSYLLHFLGVYPFVLEALLDCIQGVKQFYFPLESIILLGNLSIGIGVGGFAFAHFLNWLLKNYFNMTIALLSGFLIGTWQSVWPFWSYEYILFPLKLEKGPQLIPQSPFLPDLNTALFWQALCCTILSSSIILVIHRLTNKKSRIYT